MSTGPSFLDHLREHAVLILDGAMGTEIQKLSLGDDAWGGHPGCNEALNLSAPDIIGTIHRAYLAAGADVIETNTFGASASVLSEYGLGGEARTVARAAATIAREAAADVKDRPCFVAGSLGPGTKLPSLGHTDFDGIYDAYLPAVQGLLDGGIDLFLLETCQDPLQIKACVCAIRDALSGRKLNIPVAASVTVETTGTLLVGTEVQAAVAILSALSVDIIGINCATGPSQMAPHVQELCRSFPGPVLVMPNAGLPENINGSLVYTLEPKAFAEELLKFVTHYGVNIVGGCCGTSPDHIRALNKALDGVHPAGRTVEPVHGVASLYSFQELRQEPAPFFVGERANTNGSKQFREYLLAENWDGMVEVGKNQVRSGAHAVDLCVAYAGRDEIADIVRIAPRFTLEVPLPLVIDSTSPAVIEAALKRCGGRAVINSINLEEGEERTRRVCALARRYGAAVIALTIDEEGMARTAEKKLAVARRLFGIAVEEGLAPFDLIFDPLTFTLGSGDETLKTAAIETLRGIELIKENLPGVFTLLGLSNISFGLNPRSRQILNSVFLFRAVQAGLDLAIVNVAQIVPVSRIDEADLKTALNLIDNAGPGNPLLRFIEHFDRQASVVEENNRISEESLSPEDLLRKRLIDGSRAGLEELLERVLGSIPPAAIINDILVPAMKQVGELFGSGRMQLPFVLQSAEVMKRSVDYLTPRMDTIETTRKNSIVLATVKGDVHDIGKNLVDIILSNNGFQVHNLGIRIDIEEIISTARDVGADAIGMSGLLVKSTQVMKENLEFMKARGLDIPVLLGGAALTQSYVMETCDPILDSPVLYCEDAFKGLRAMTLLKEGKLAEYNEAEKIRHASPLRQARTVATEDVESLGPASSIPEPPFRGSRVLDTIMAESIFPYLNERALFRARWGFRSRGLGPDEFDALIRKEAVPALEAMKERLIREKILSPRALYGYWPCQTDGDVVQVLDPDDITSVIGLFHYPRQKKRPFRSIADYFLPKGSGTTDLIALQAVTIGPGLDELVHGLYEAGEYRDYLFYHGLGVELAEAMAELVHALVRDDLGLGRPGPQGPDKGGLRYSFGYSPCPSLDDNRTLLDILGAGRIGISTVESGEMVPEQSTCAFIVHHPGARYFTIE